MAGPYYEEDASKPEYTEQAWKALKEINEQENRMYYYIPIKVVRVHSRILGGLLNVIEVLVGQTSCQTMDLPIESVTSSNCEVVDGGYRVLYRVTVWERPWLNLAEVTTVERLRDVSDDEQI